MTVNTRYEGSVGYVEIDNAPVNAISLLVRQGLLAAVQWAEELNLERVIVSGSGGIFAAGADVREFDSPPTEPNLPDVLNAIDESHVPWIAAIEGVALGGGAEIALACRMRIMATSARIGFPEVTLGVIPGAGGTQRLPHLVGLANALDMITSGRPLNAETALDIGLVHAVDVEPLYAAFMVNGEALATIVSAQDLPVPAADQAVINAARDHVALKSAGQIAPLRAIEVIETGLSLSLREGLVIERRAFLDLRGSDQAVALRHIFFAERGARVPAGLKADAVISTHVVVVGGGAIGSGIAYALLNAGVRVTIIEADNDGVERAHSNIQSLVSEGLNRGVIDGHAAGKLREGFVATTDYALLTDATLAIEATLEGMDAKRPIFAALEGMLPAVAIIASNTSYGDLDEIAMLVSDPARVVGLHFFNQAHETKILEIVRGGQTSDTALATSYALAKRLRKVPVVVGVCDGLVADRILARYHEAADTVFMDGSSPWEIDDAMVEFGFSIGPYAEQDILGLDTAHAIRRRQDAKRNPARRYIPIADRMFELGKYGRKTGAGWYRYPGGSGRVDDPIVADLGIEEAYFAGVKRVDYTADEMCQRLLLAMINEAADLLHEGIAQSAADIDLVSVLGFGFPRWRGGLMHHADTLGVKWIVSQLELLCNEDPVAWKISPLLSHCAATDTRIGDFVAVK